MTADDRLGRLERHLSEMLAGPRRLMRSLSKTTTGTDAMTIPTEVAAVLAEMKNPVFGKVKHQGHVNWAKRIESALTEKAEAVALGYANPASIANAEVYLIWPEHLKVAGYVPVYAHAPPAAPVESLGRDAEDELDRAKEAWDDVFDGTNTRSALQAVIDATRQTPRESVSSVPDGWRIIRDDSEIRICAPNGRPGGMTLTAKERSLPGRILYALALSLTNQEGAAP